MANLSLWYSMCATVIFAFLLLAGSSQARLRAYPNPLNGERIDLFFVIDQRPQYMMKTDFVFLKATIADIATNLNGNGATACFGSYFYGPSATLLSPFPFCTKSSTEVRAKLDLLVYPVSPTNPTTLIDALNAVDAQCTASCRANTPRATIIVSSNLDRSAASLIRQLERSMGMIVIVLAIGSNSENAASASLLSSYPQNDFAIPIGSYNTMNIFSSYVGSIIADIPRPFPLQNIVVADKSNDSRLHSLQINTAAITTTNEAIVILASNCRDCSTYASLTELIPSDVNSPAFIGRQFYLGTGSYSYVSYFRVPRNTTRLFVSFKGDPSTTMSVTCDVIAVPSAMAFPVVGRSDLEEITIG